MKREAGGFAPEESGLSLIGETNGLQAFIDVEAISGGLIDGLGHAHLHTLQDLHGVMLHPPGLRVELGELHVVASYYSSLRVVYYEPAAARSLVDRANKHILFRHPLP